MTNSIVALKDSNDNWIMIDPLSFESLSVRMVRTPNGVDVPRTQIVTKTGNTHLVKEPLENVRDYWLASLKTVKG